MDIASVYVKNMLWSLSFGTVAQTVCVCCSERKGHLFVRDLCLAAHQCLLCRRVSVVIAWGIWGSFMHRVHIAEFYERERKKSKEIFISFCVLQI